jgi:hypothetical protein
MKKKESKIKRKIKDTKQKEREKKVDGKRNRRNKFLQSESELQKLRR